MEKLERQIVASGEAWKTKRIYLGHGKFASLLISTNCNLPCLFFFSVTRIISPLNISRLSFLAIIRGQQVFRQTFIKFFAIWIHFLNGENIIKEEINHSYRKFVLNSKAIRLHNREIKSLINRKEVQDLKSNNY